MELCALVHLLLEECGRDVDTPTDPGMIMQVYSTLEDMRHWYVEKVLRACQGNITVSARVLGVSNKTIYNMRRKWR